VRTAQSGRYLTSGDNLPTYFGDIFYFPNKKLTATNRQILVHAAGNYFAFTTAP
jgi:hypothetical protein